MPFGYAIEPEYDPAKERRWTILGWTLIAGTVICTLYLFTGRPFAVQVFQAWLATVSCYGATVYVNRRHLVCQAWLWRGLAATLPIHILYMASLFWLDARYPEVMKKAVAFVPLLAVGFAFEAVVADKIIDYFAPENPESRLGLT